MSAVPPEASPAVLDEESLLTAARARTGLEDFGPDHFLASLRALLAALAARPLSAEQRRRAFDGLRDLLALRLAVVGDRARYPGIAAERIVRPVFVMGQARSGTTLLHALLAEDPANRAPVYWEVAHPSPPGPAASDDPRIAQAESEMAEILAGIPGLLQAHPYWGKGALSLMECPSLAAWDFRGQYPVPFLWQVPVLGAFRSDDWRAWYEAHRALLQHLQWGAPPRRWVLKGTYHHFHLHELLAVYPGALLIWPHRDPVQVYGSVLELMSVLTRGVTGAVDREAFAAGYLAQAEQDTRALLADPLIDDPRICHVRFPELTRDPAGAVRRVYEHFGLPCTPAFEQRMQAWLADPENAPDRYGRFTYSLEPFGVTAEEIERRFADYKQRFGV